MLYRQFYSELAKLLYAVANVDGKISDQEREELKTIVRKELVPAEHHTDKFGTDAAYYTEIEFDFLEEAMIEPQAAFESYLNFVELHHTAIDSRMREVSLRTAKKIADTYHKTNKKEKDLINALEKKLAALPAK
ncbi:MAG: hypothetical protein V4615_11830 [Bacteroidota bacterium]